MEWKKTQKYRLLHGPCQRSENAVEHKGGRDTNSSWCTWNNLQRFEKGIRRTEKQRKNWDQLNYSKNTQKCTGDLRRLVVTQPLLKDHQLILLLKTRKEQNNYNNKVIWFVTFGLVLWHINHCRLFNAKSIFIHRNSSISNNSVQHKNSFFYSQLNVKTILLQTIQFGTSTQFNGKKSSISNNSAQHKYSFFVYTLSNVKQFYVKQFSFV